MKYKYIKNFLSKPPLFPFQGAFRREKVTREIMERMRGPRRLKREKTDVFFHITGNIPFWP